MSLTLITGPMYSGKSRYLLDLYDRLPEDTVMRAYKPREATRDGSVIQSRDREFVINCQMIRDPLVAWHQAAGVHTIIFDEIQFFWPPERLVDAVWRLGEEGKHVVAAGLLHNFRHQAFDTTSRLMALADDHIILRARCRSCGSPNAIYNCIEEGAVAGPINQPEANYIPICHLCIGGYPYENLHDVYISN